MTNGWMRLCSPYCWIERMSAVEAREMCWVAKEVREFDETDDSEEK